MKHTDLLDLEKSKQEVKLKNIYIGGDDFRRYIREGYYYIDKTKFIEDFIKSGEMVSLITRPRRFGKTMNISMLQCYFDIAENTKDIFKDLYISKSDVFDEYINSVPVLYLTFKDCVANNRENLLIAIYGVVVREIKRLFTKEEQQLYELDGFMLEFNESILSNILQDITRALYQKYNTATLVLMDEYDTPIISAYGDNYFEEVRKFFATFYGSVLKGNDKYLHKAMLTGITRVARNNIFSGLDNLVAFTVNDYYYNDCFGITKPELKILLEYYNMEYSKGIDEFYNGYSFRGEKVYNPWAIMLYIRKKELDFYWANTSSNTLIKYFLHELGEEALIFMNDILVKDYVETSYKLNDMVFEEVTLDSFKGLLINSGYLTIKEAIENNYGKLCIPNKEVRADIFTILNSSIIEKGNTAIDYMKKGILELNMKLVEKAIEKLLLNCFSYHDLQEYAYHVFMNTLMLHVERQYKINSNLEMGYGRSDIYLEPREKNMRPIIIELKWYKSDENTKDETIERNLEKLSEKALEQIRINKYDYNIEDVFKIGIAFCKKRFSLKYED